MRWIALPLVAAAVLGWSGFLHDLDRMTQASVDLAAASEEAPRTTGEAAEEVSSLPQVARLTTQQADAFEGLGNALELSADRVIKLNESLDEQAGGIDAVVGGIRRVKALLGCVRERLVELTSASDRVPPALNDITGTLGLLEDHQRKSLRHLKSINRKLTALGVAARATDVKAPRPPDIPAIELPREGAAPIDC
ncbi:MAG TPA: hypothetical protein VNP73_07660 [Actinomycetota bacterium]|nr:hypothetical protein [Actinomycetota bacterium]